jgi:hypothetical protein
VPDELGVGELFDVRVGEFGPPDVVIVIVGLLVDPSEEKLIVA